MFYKVVSDYVIAFCKLYFDIVASDIFVWFLKINFSNVPERELNPAYPPHEQNVRYVDLVLPFSLNNYVNSFRAMLEAAGPN